MKSRTRIAATLTAALTVLGGSAVAATSASATSPMTTGTTGSSSNPGKTLAQIQAMAALDITRRTDALNTAIAEVNANKELTSGDRATLLGTLNGDLSGLAALGQKIAQDTTAAQAWTDFQMIFTEFRVFALAIPQARLAAAADDITGAVLPNLTAAQTTLEGLLAGVDSGKDTPRVQELMADLNNQIHGVENHVDGLSATVLGYTPADYNANHALLTPARGDLNTSRDDIGKARADITAVVAALQ